MYRRETEFAALSRTRHIYSRYPFSPEDGKLKSLFNTVYVIFNMLATIKNVPSVSGIATSLFSFILKNILFQRLSAIDKQKRRVIIVRTNVFHQIIKSIK